MKNFEEIKEQLKNLAEVVNKFESEAVQLKIVEFVLSPEVEQRRKTSSSNSKRRSTRKKTTVKPTDESQIKRASKKSVGSGAVAALNKLIEEDFFKDPKTIGDIVEYCEHNMARKFKSNQFSGKLARLVRNETLIREKNSENQYEYRKK